jgi:glycosyltransferase involved in cell wall biosynthesis
MLRVAYLFERFPSFGQTFCYREVAELIRQGAEVTVFSIRRPSGEPAEAWDGEIVERVTYLPSEADLVKEIDRANGEGKLRNVAARTLKEWGRQSDFLRLYQAAYVGTRLQEAGVERVHAHFAGMAARTAYWIKQFFGIEYSLTAHANDIFEPRDFVVSLTSILDAARAIVTVSDFAVDRLKMQFPHNARKIHRVYNGVDLREFPSARFEKTTPLILSVGRLIEKKGFSDLIGAAEILRRDRSGFRCEIIGEGPLEPALRKQIGVAGLEDRVHLLGPKTQAEIAQRLAAATVFVLPCRPAADGDMDNLPTVIMEAMAAGLPVISTMLAGIPEMVQPGVTGELVPPRNPAALAQMIERVLSDSELARDYGQRGRELAAERFSIEKNVTLLAKILGGDG